MTLKNDQAMAYEWEVKAQQLQFTALDNIKAKTATWVTYVPLLLAAVTGLAAWTSSDALMKLTGDAQDVVRTGIFVGALLSFIAYWFASLAAQTVPASILTNGEAYQDHVEKESATAAYNLNFSRWFTFLAVSLLLATALYSRTAGVQAPASKLRMVYLSDGTVLCGRVTTSAAGQLQFSAMATTSPQPLRNVATGRPLEVVTACP
ncbi:hypothetical protein DEIPH_ctg014orf0008 [Deinococcus phoenicis]|uniref:Uncharacterized protein n=1 Tax=Deinococcus phoenicis TaxID=1476583 RepID=A0A016QSB2_9DEIO|nr:hypothetical protein [Deinococcus phoenicis]EYB68881.1 hypothetical protein DEIPH_ctg014orf0008 [Deinococcus phoenicis]